MTVMTKGVAGKLYATQIEPEERENWRSCDLVNADIATAMAIFGGRDRHVECTL